MSEESATGRKIREVVREGYAAIAGGGCCGPAADGATAGCCAPASDPDTLAAAIGYSREELENLPKDANLGLSCGNPAAIAALQPGQTVLDLGCGAGFDVFLAGPKVGPEGRVIGVDMTPQMLDRARANAADYRARTGLDNVEFRLGEIEHLPLGDAEVDVVISNCVINLSSDKARVWAEIARVLRPGGRVAVSDMALLRPLPEAVLEKVHAWIGCVAGAVLVDDYERMIRDAGLDRPLLIQHPDYVEALSQGDDPFYREIAGLLPEGMVPADFVTSVQVSASKDAPACDPASGCC